MGNTNRVHTAEEDPVDKLFRSDLVLQMLIVLTFILFIFTHFLCPMEKCQWKGFFYFLFILLMALGFKLGYAVCKYNIRRSQQVLQEMKCE